MVMETRTAKRADAGLSNASEAMINSLPDALLCAILLYLPTKEVVRTSGVHPRWRNVWRLIPELDLDSNEFPDYKSFVSFMDKFLDFFKDRKSCLGKLKLSIRKDEKKSSVKRWLDFFATRELKHLDVACLVGARKCLKVIPLSLYICKTLIYLRLHCVSLGSFDRVSLPCLKIMSLEGNVYANEKSLESLISSCPVIEDVSVVRKDGDNVEVLRVHSQTLTSLSVGYDNGDNARLYSKFITRSSGLSIDAPRLNYLNFNNDDSRSKIIINSGSLAKVKFDAFFGIGDPSGHGVDEIPNNEMARNFLTGISSVTDMIISDYTMEFFYDYSRFEQFPQFCYLSNVEAAFDSFNLKFLPTFLESCPNLKSIVLELTISPQYQPAISWSSSPEFVPQCLSTSLEFVKIKSEFMGRHVEIKVARYFVENSPLLEKLVLHFGSSLQKERCGLFLREIHKLLNLSTMCQIECVADADC